MSRYDFLIVGAGILGLSTALKLLQKNPSLKVAILEKEARIAAHQTGHNSGVIHSGIYYKPGSLKAVNCRSGVKQLYNFLIEKQIPYEKCGKLIVAKELSELPALDELQRRGTANGVPGLKRLSRDEMLEIEPYLAGVAALYSPDTAIVDYVQVAKAYLKEIQQMGGELFLSSPVIGSHGTFTGVIIETPSSLMEAKMAINCAGFHADRVANLTDPGILGNQIIPFRGEYYELKETKRNLVKGLIYPVPDPRFPFLGVHLSKTIEGRVEAGPNAVLALSREGYLKSQISFKDCADMLTYPGFWKMAFKYWKVGAYELYRSYSKRAFLHSLQQLIPSLNEEDLIPAEAGVRSQVVLPNGALQDDFLIRRSEGWIHVLNAPSPAATASLAIGDHIATLALG